MMLNSSIEISLLNFIIVLIGILAIILIIFQLTRQKYEAQLKKLQDEAMLKFKALNEKIELNHNSYENQINSLNTTNRQLEEEKKLIKETLEDKINLVEKHKRENEKNIINNYELKLDSLSDICEEKEKSFNEKEALLEEYKVQMKKEFDNLLKEIKDIAK